MLSFIEYCHSKSIDAASFKKNEDNLYTDLEFYFNQIHPDSFTAQKLFLINEIRRRYHFIKPESVKEKGGEKKQALPLMKKAVIVGSKPKVPGVKVGVVKQKIPVSTSKSTKPKPVIPGVKKVSVLSPKIEVSKSDKKEGEEKKLPALKPKIVGRKTLKTETSGASLKPIIPSVKKESVLKPEIGNANVNIKEEDGKKTSALKPKIGKVTSKPDDLGVKKFTVLKPVIKTSKSDNTEEVEKNSSVLKPKIVIPGKVVNPLKPKIPKK